MWYIIIAVIAVIVLFLAVVLIRTLNFKPKKNVEVFENEECLTGKKQWKTFRSWCGARQCPAMKGRRRMKLNLKS